jgi:hypothetical protein
MVTVQTVAGLDDKLTATKDEWVAIVDSLFFCWSFSCIELSEPYNSD